MFSAFFIKRPVLSCVLSIMIILLGLAALPSLPVAQYPQVVPPQVVVSATYPGASAEAAADAVAAPLESALSRLPEEVITGGVTVTKESNALLKIVSLTSPDGSRDPIFLNNYALMTIQDELQRTPGVGQVTMFSSKSYAIRIWLRPDKMAEYNLTTADIDAAITEQNAQFAAGSFGAPPNPIDTPEFALTVTTDGRFSTVDEFEDIILRGSSTRCRSTPPSLSKCQSIRSSAPCSKPCCWWWVWCTCFFSASGPPSFRCWPFRSR